MPVRAAVRDASMQSRRLPQELSVQDSPKGQSHRAASPNLDVDDLHRGLRQQIGHLGPRIGCVPRSPHVFRTRSATEESQSSTRLERIGGGGGQRRRRRIIQTTAEKSQRRGKNGRRRRRRGCRIRGLASNRPLSEALLPPPRERGELGAHVARLRPQDRHGCR